MAVRSTRRTDSGTAAAAASRPRSPCRRRYLNSIRLTGILALCARNARVLRRHLGTTILTHVGDPIFYILIFGYGLGSFVPSIDGQLYFDWLLPALAVTSAAVSAGVECTYGAFTKMERQKTYLAIASTPVSIEEVVAGEALWGALLGTLNAVAALVLGALCGAHLTTLAVLSTIGLAFLAGFFSASFSLWFTSRAHGYEAFGVYFTVIITPIVLLSGAYFPLATFPAPIAGLATLLPLTQAVLATRTPGWAALGHAAVVALYAIPVFYCAMRGIARRVIP